MIKPKYDGADLGSAPLELIINQQGQPGLFFGKGSVRDRDLADGDFKGSCLFNLGIKQGAPHEEFPENGPILSTIPIIQYLVVPWS